VPRLRAAHQSDEIAGSPAPQAARRGGNNKFACYMWEVLFFVFFVLF
jgi:hypothetical protein